MNEKNDGTVIGALPQCGPRSFRRSYPPSVLEIRSPRLLMRVRLGMLSWVVESAVQSSLTVLASGGSAAAAEDAGV